MSEDTIRASARIDAPPAHVYGIIADYRNGHPVTEPQPGRILVESNMDPDPSVTTFIVESVDSGRASDVTIETRLGMKPGIIGSIERAMSTRFLKSLYREELALLAAKARSG